jgi:glutathione S-transferase
MSQMRLLIANKNYSSWSLRPWLALTQFDIPFQEERIALFVPGYKERILAVSPTGKVPVLVDGERVIWDSLAIGEYLAEKFPDRAIWPRDMDRRAMARCVSAEMHAGFMSLRGQMPMNIRKRHAVKEGTPELVADIARMMQIWVQCLDKSGGPFLFGEFCYADAMFAPVVTRFTTYGARLENPLKAYSESIWALPGMQAWKAAALAETEVIEAYESAD